MTLIVRLTINGYPMLLGDILLTAPLETPDYLQFPTVRTLHPTPKSEIKPVQFRQKLKVISDDLVIGWAGLTAYAQPIVNELISLNAARPLNARSFGDYIERLRSQLQGDVEFGMLGFVRDREAEGIRFLMLNLRGAEEIDLDRYGNVCLLGTGSAHAKRILAQESIYLKPEITNNPGGLIGAALRLSGRFLSDEFAIQESLKNFYGAGYEISFFMGHRFQKLDDFVYIQWVARMFDDEIRYWLFNVSKFKYVGEVLTVRIARLVDMNSSDLEIVPTLTIVQPIEKTIDEDFDLLPRPDFNSSLQCSNILMAHPKTDKMLSFTFVEGGSPEAGPRVRSIHFEEQGDLLEYRHLLPNFEEFLKVRYSQWLSEPDN